MKPPPRRRPGTLRRALVSGTVASVTSSIALAVMARIDKKGMLQPVNATSHWRNGEQAASVKRADYTHTVVGYATHHAATMFWAVLFERWIGSRPPGSFPAMLRDAAAMSALAAAIDYGLTPRPLTPGWESVLSGRAMAVGYGALAIGLAAGAWSNQNRHP
ncbi:hypothetical protein [Lichenicola sp.]|uniref:hypothetical protein n=1 Tax=Lichenicola sp. TaxID=2804529 RepID=UPI003B005793